MPLVPLMRATFSPGTVRRNLRNDRQSKRENVFLRMTANRAGDGFASFPSWKPRSLIPYQLSMRARPDCDPLRRLRSSAERGWPATQQPHAAQPPVRQAWEKRCRLFIHATAQLLIERLVRIVPIPETEIARPIGLTPRGKRNYLQSTGRDDGMCRPMRPSLMPAGFLLYFQTRLQSPRVSALLVT